MKNYGDIHVNKLELGHLWNFEEYFGFVTGTDETLS
jgi:hypothetical protein